MRENRSSGLMRGGKSPVIGSIASHPVTSRLLYNEHRLRGHRGAAHFIQIPHRGHDAVSPVINHS